MYFGSESIEFFFYLLEEVLAVDFSKTLRYVFLTFQFNFFKKKVLKVQIF
jgi:hypothetical protein